MHSPMHFSPVSRTPNDRTTSKFESTNYQNFTSASKFRKLKTEVITDPETDSHNMSKRSHSRLVNQERFLQSQSMTSVREVSPMYLTRNQVLNESSRTSKSSKQIPSIQKIASNEAADNTSQTQKSPSLSEAVPFTKTCETFGFRNIDKKSQGKLNERENNPHLQAALQENSILREELALCRTQQDKYVRLYQQSKSAEEALLEKVAKFEAALKNVREDNRLLRMKVQGLDYIVTSNHLAEEMATKYEEEKHANSHLTEEIGRLRASLQESQQAYIHLVNEFNRNKLTLIKSQRSIEAFPISTLISNPTGQQHYQSKPPISQDYESTIVNNDIKRMLGSPNDETLNSIFAGTSAILKCKTDDSFLDSNVRHTTHGKSHVGQNFGNVKLPGQTSQNYLPSAQRHEHSPLLSTNNSSAKFESDAKNYAPTYFNE